MAKRKKLLQLYEVDDTRLIKEVKPLLLEERRVSEILGKKLSRADLIELLIDQFLEDYA